MPSSGSSTTSRHASVLARLESAFVPEAAAGEHVAYQIELSGEAPGSLWADIRDGRLELGTGRIAHPNVTIHLAFEDFVGVLTGQENPDLLFMEERIRVDGELALALKLRKLFRASA